MTKDEILLELYAQNTETRIYSFKWVDIAGSGTWTAFKGEVTPIGELTNTKLIGAIGTMERMAICGAPRERNEALFSAELWREMLKAKLQSWPKYIELMVEMDIRLKRGILTSDDFFIGSPFERALCYVRKK